MQNGTPVFVMNTGPERQTGHKAQISNITAAKTVADVIRTCLGPKSMLKMILDPMGGILLTNDGNAILREIDVAHPAAKNMIDLSRTQDEEVGDGTTSVIILAGEILAQSLPQLERNIHPVVIISAFQKALKDALEIITKISTPIDTTNEKEMLALIKTSIGTKFVQRWSDLMCKLALQAIRTVAQDDEGIKTVDIKRYARVEKVPGGEIEDSRVLDGVMLNKDVVHPAMKRKIVNPRIILLDCPLEYKKGESQTNIEISKEDDYDKILRQEEEQIKMMVDKILELKPTLIFSEKGVSELATYHLQKAGVTALRRVRKADNNRIARAVGATIVNRVEDLRESDVGTKCGLFHVEKLGDEYFTFLTQCQSPKACTILLRGPSKDILNEIDRNLADAMAVARNVVFHPYLAPGGGATEMAISVGLAAKARTIEGVEGYPYRAVADAMEVIPRTLVQNAGGNAIRVLTELRAKHANGENSWGINGETGKIVDMKVYGLYESASVKIQTLKTSIEAARMLLRVDDIVQARRKERQGGEGVQQMGGDGEMPEQMEPYYRLSHLRANRRRETNPSKPRHHEQPAMHRVWMIPELSSEMIAGLYNKDRPTMMRVCRLLWEIAVPIVWRSIKLEALKTVYDMESLEIKLKIPDGPSRRRRLKAALRIGKPLPSKSAAVSRLQAYIDAVKSCYYTCPLAPKDSLAEYVSSFASITTLLPRVTRIYLDVHPPEAREENLLKCLACCAINDLTLISRSQKAGSDTGVVDILEAMPARLQKLHLKIATSHPAGVSNIVKLHPDLRSLTLKMENRDHVYDAWNAVAALPRLREFAFRGADWNNAYTRDADRGFATLQSVTIGHVFLPQARSFLESITSPYLKRIKIEYIDDVRDILRPCLECIPQLQLQDVMLEIPMARRAWDCTTSLPVCTSITQLRYGTHRLPLNDEHIEVMAQAMPNLRDLDVRHILPPTYSDTKVATLHGLLVLAPYCPDLRTLSIDVDARWLVEIPKPFPYQNRALRALDLQRSRATGGNLDLIAQFIATLWPNHRDRTDGWRGRDADWVKIWELVEEGLAAHETGAAGRYPVDSE